MDPLHRERQAHEEIGRTAVSRPLAAALVALFLATSAAVPVAERLRADPPAPWADLAAGARAAAATFRERGLLAANRELLAAMNAFEDRLDEDSAVARLALPWAQWLQTAVLGAGNEQVVLGRDGWLYYVPAVEHLTGPGFLEPDTLRRRAAGGATWQARPQPDPLAALLALRHDLAERGIALAVLPTPVKAAIHPEHLVRRLPPSGAPLANPSWGRFVESLEAAGVAVVDPAADLLADARASGAPQFLATDTHWTPAAVERTAALAAARLEALGLVPREPGAAFRTQASETVTGIGDLARLLKLPEAGWGGGGAALFPPQTVPARRVVAADGRAWAPDPDAQVLLLGDSYTNVFSQPDLGWGEGAGLAEHLSVALGAPVDRIAVDAGGAHASRAWLYELLAADSPRLAAKRLVIYQFSARELTHGDWTLFDPATGRPRDDEPRSARPSGPATALPSPPDVGPETTGEPGADEGSGEWGETGPSLPWAGRPSPPARVGEGSGERGEMESNLGSGYVVWESNRSGDWRIWIQRLDGTGLVQLTPDEPGLQHCCPHVSPDGTRVAYLARAAGRDAYPETEVAGPLRLVAVDPATARPAASRTVAEAARTYGWGDRAVVWRDDRELIHVAGDGRTVLLDVATGVSRDLTAEPRAELGWLIDRTLRWATHAAPSFSRYDAAARRVLERRELGGCEPYFSHDGRWGVFMPAGGGPIQRIDPETREIATLVPKWDPRIPGGKGYLYFPMPSRDGRVLAFGASAGEHDHFRSDYEIYAAPTDPATLELEGPPVRLTDHPATDRYPDAWLAPLPLGRHNGEVPFHWTTPSIPRPLSHPQGGKGAPPPTVWSFGDGASGRGDGVLHTYAEPGTYEVTAERGGETLRGRVVVRPARPPQVVEVTVRSATRELEVAFDEPVRLAAGFRAELASGVAVAGHRLEAGDRRLVLALGAALEKADRLRLAGVTDQAQRPNPLPGGEIDVAPPAWPSDRRALAFLWQTGDQPNEIFDAELRGEVADPLAPHGRARLDRHHRMVLGGGWFTAPEAAGRRLLRAAARSGEVSLEATVTPAAGESAAGALAPIVTFSRGPGARNLTLGQRGGDLVARVRTGPTGPNADRPEIRLFPVAPGRTVHVVVTYSPGLLNAYRDGEPVLESRDVHGGLDRWRPFALAFGAEPGGAGDWSGTLEGVALYSRVLTPREVQENHLRHRELRDRRQDAPAGRRAVRATLEATSAIPTLRQITPYRRALAVYAWRIDELLEGESGPFPVKPGDRLRIAHWVLLDGERTPAAGLRPGATRRLELEPYEANPQLEAHYLSDTLAAGEGGGLWFAAGE